MRALVVAVGLGLVLPAVPLTAALSNPAPPAVVVSSAALDAPSCASSAAVPSEAGEPPAGTGIVQMCVDVSRNTPGPSWSPSPAPEPSPSASTPGVHDDDAGQAPPDLALTGASPWVMAAAVGVTALAVGVALRRPRGASRT